VTYYLFKLKGAPQVLYSTNHTVNMNLKKMF